MVNYISNHVNRKSGYKNGAPKNTLLGIFGGNKRREKNYDNYLSNQRTLEEREFNSAQAQKQMDFQREMSNTAHQRQVEDLKSAGLNPVLSATSGASSPSGASASSSAAKTSSMQSSTDFVQVVNAMSAFARSVKR